MLSCFLLNPPLATVFGSEYVGATFPGSGCCLPLRGCRETAPEVRPPTNPSLTTQQVAGSGTKQAASRPRQLRNVHLKSTRLFIHPMDVGCWQCQETFSQVIQLLTYFNGKVKVVKYMTVIVVNVRETHRRCCFIN